MTTGRDDLPEIVDILPPRPEKPPTPPRDWGRLRPRLSGFQWFTLHGAVAMFVLGSLTGIGMTRAALAPSPSASPGPSGSPDGSPGSSATLRPGEPTPFHTLSPLANGHRRFVVTEDSVGQGVWPASLQAFMERLPERITTADVQWITNTATEPYWRIQVSGDEELGKLFEELRETPAVVAVDPDRKGPSILAGPGFAVRLSSSLEAPAVDGPAGVRFELTATFLAEALDDQGRLRAVESGAPADPTCTLVERPTGFAAEVAATMVARGAQGVEVVRACDGSGQGRDTIVVGRVEGDGTHLVLGILDRFVAGGVSARLVTDGYGSLGCGIEGWALRPGMVGHWNDDLGSVSGCYLMDDPLRPGWFVISVTLVPADLDAAGRLIPDAVP